MTPNLASGAGQAVEVCFISLYNVVFYCSLCRQDSLFLATLLAQPEVGKEEIPSALAIYDETRRPFTQNVQELSYKAGQTVNLDSPRTQSYSAEASAAGAIPEKTVKEIISEDLADCQKWTWATTPQADLELAIQKLKAGLTGSN